MPLMKSKLILIFSSLAFTFGGTVRANGLRFENRGVESIDQVIRANLGVAGGVQVNPSLACKFEVSETHPDHFLLMLTLDGPSRMIGAHFSGDSRFFWFDPSAHTITFDRTAIGRANVVYTYDPSTLKVISVEEEGEETCKIKTET
jgi:hypothetical protein